MFIILSIHSKNANSLTNFLKFLYTLNKKNFFKLKFYIKQSKKKENSSFFSVLQSPHVNKKSQEQFECFVYSKQLKIQVCQLTQFLFI
jgi:ribosomal protein S10